MVTSGGLQPVLQAAIGDGLLLDPFSVRQDGCPACEVDVGGGQIVDALVITSMIVVFDEGGDLNFEAIAITQPDLMIGISQVEEFRSNLEGIAPLETYDSALYAEDGAFDWRADILSVGAIVDRFRARSGRRRPHGDGAEPPQRRRSPSSADGAAAGVARN